MRKLTVCSLLCLSVTQLVIAGEIITVAGGGPRNMPALSANLFRPVVIVEPAGNLFIGGPDQNLVFRVDASGFLTIYAGNGLPGFEGDGGPATEAALSFPFALALDTAGNLYIADHNNGRVRRVDAVTGSITSVITGLSGPGGIVLDSAGNLYVADRNRVLRFDAVSRSRTTVAGTGIDGFSGDGGPATNAQLSGPNGLALDAAGNLFISDELNRRIRRVEAATGTITTVAGGGNGSGDNIPATSARLGFPSGIALDGAGRLLIADRDTDRIRRVNLATGIISTVANLRQPMGVALDSGGNVFVSTLDRIHRLDAASGFVTVVAGGGTGGDGGPATDAGLSPVGVAVDMNGDLYIASPFPIASGLSVRRVDGTTGIIGSLGNLIHFPTRLAVDRAGNLYAALPGAPVVARVSIATGVATTVAGGGSTLGDGGPATGAIVFPAGVAVDAVGNLFIADAGNQRIRLVDVRSGIITTVAGNGVADFCGDGGPATSACLNRPEDVAVDPVGNIYIADTFNNRIRKVDSITGIINTVGSISDPRGVTADGAGNIYVASGDNRVRRIGAATGAIVTVAGGGQTLGDGGPATMARLYGPTDVAVDENGNLFIADPLSHRVRRVTPGNQLPIAMAGADAEVECPGTVLLDGSASTDADSSAGTNDDIISFEWFETFPSSSQVLLGTGAILPVTLPLGRHFIALKVTDSAGQTDTDDVIITVVDTTPPDLAVEAVPRVLWPPNHRMVGVQAVVAATDACSVPAVMLASLTSSEPDDAPDSGDGNTTGDIQDASIGTSDTIVQLRVERSGDGPGRTYSLVYQARDAAGNLASALGLVTVPHDLGAGAEPLMMSLEPAKTDGMTHFYWNAVPGAEMYDLIQGDLDQITTHSGVLWLGPVRVLASGITGTSYADGATGQVPAVGKAFFYLVQYRDGLRPSGWGTESSPWPAEPTSCDVGCPGEAIETSIASGDPLRK